MELQNMISELVLVIVAILGTCQALRTFQDKIPNGDSVPNKCATNDGDQWAGVGHLAIAGTGPRNDFGVAFKAANLVWTTDLCMEDTDGDGVTNGAELGDPECVWTEGATPAGAATGHPAICEPVNTSDCITKNSWIQDCPAKDVGLVTVATDAATAAADSTTVAPDTATEAATAGSNAETTTAQVEEANNGAETTTVPAETTTSKGSSISSVGVCLVLTMIATLLL